jgi:carboxymethylenebutenolidase
MDEHVILEVGGQAVWGYVAEPEGTPRGCLVVLHEAFGVTPHIRRVCEDYAKEGYVAVAPALLALATGTPEGAVLPVDLAGFERGRELIMKISKDQIVEAVRAFVGWGAARGLRVGVVGFCWGGSCSYLAASRLPEIAACSSYYGGYLWEIVAEGQPGCPRMVHLARLDRYIPLEKTVAAFAAHDPGCEVHVYEADHAFNRNDSKTWEPESARLARARTLEMFAKSIG